MLSRFFNAFKTQLYQYFLAWQQQLLAQIRLPKNLQQLFIQGGLEVETLFIYQTKTGLYFRTQIQIGGDVIQSLPDPEQYTDPAWRKAWLQHYQQHQIILNKQLLPLLQFKQTLINISASLSSIMSAILLWWQDWQVLINTQSDEWLQLGYTLLIIIIIMLALFWIIRQALLIWIKRYI